MMFHIFIFTKKTSQKFLPHQPVLLIKCKGQTEVLTHYFKRKENIFKLIQLKIYITVDITEKFKIFSRGNALGTPSFSHANAFAL